MERDEGWRRRFRRALNRWYARHARDLPWRTAREPYEIWISEIMLQQTTVAAVVPYFERFLARFPTVHDLAQADEHDVLRLWEGLGYYSRARNLHRASRTIVAEYAGRFPSTVAELRTLPGIGRYTAGAIVSFAFDRPAPIVEANTSRLYCRLLGYAGDSKSSEGQRILWDFAEEILPRRAPGRTNQALMDLGATVCTPAAPNCPACPLKSCCRAFADGTQAVIPKVAARPDVTRLFEAAVAVRKNGRVLLRQRGPDEWWTGLWDFPRIPFDDEQDASTSELERRLRAQLGLRIVIGRRLGEFAHSVTRYRIRLHCYAAEYRGGRLPSGESLRWMRPAELESLALSKPGRRIATMMNMEAP